jgi:acyl dehydratase
VETEDVTTLEEEVPVFPGVEITVEIAEVFPSDNTGRVSTDVELVEIEALEIAGAELAGVRCSAGAV